MASNFLNDSDEFADYENIDGCTMQEQLSEALNNSFTAEPLATFDLTPACSGSDGMVTFNLTPVKQEAQGYDNTVYNRQLSNTISAMTFSPPQAPPVVPIANQNQPIVTTPIANQPITPDFTGLLPPPPPTSSNRLSSSRPPPQLLAVSSSNVPQQLVHVPINNVSHVSQQLLQLPLQNVSQQVVQLAQQSLQVTQQQLQQQHQQGSLLPLSSNVSLSPNHSYSPSHRQELSPQHHHVYQQVHHQQHPKQVNQQLKSPPPQQTLYLQQQNFDQQQQSITLHSPRQTQTLLLSPPHPQPHQKHQQLLSPPHQKPNQIMSPSHSSAPPPPYKSPTYYPQLSPSPQQSSNAVQIAPNVTLIKKQKPATSVKPPVVPKQQQFQQQQQLQQQPPPSYPGEPIPTPEPPPPYVPPSPQPSPSASKSPHHSNSTNSPIQASSTNVSKLPSYSLDELKDLPGVNLKKNSVDLNAYITAMARNAHPDFENVDSFAERCLACIVRKIKSNLPTLRALLDSSLGWQEERQDPGCVLIPRMKDGRITIARPGAGAAGTGGTKKIHPHLALVQIFKNPGATNHNSLVSASHCAAPFLSRGHDDGDMDVVCISPMHYSIGTNSKSMATPKKKASSSLNSLQSSNILLSQIKSVEAGNEVVKPKKDYLQLVKARTSPGASRKQTNSVESDDFLSESDDDGIDWVKKWEEERVIVDNHEIQSFNVDELVSDIKIMTVNTKDDKTEELVEADQKLVNRLKIREEITELYDGKYNLSQLKNLEKQKPRKNKPSKPISAKKKTGPKKKMAEAWFSSESTKVKPIISPIKVPVPEPKIDPQGNRGEDDKDEATIQNLLEDIKGSFENQFDMDLDTFDTAAATGDFSMNAPFNLEELAKDNFNDGNILSKTLTSSSSDAMFGGGSSSHVLNIPVFGRSQTWSSHEDVGVDADISESDRKEKVANSDSFDLGGVGGDFAQDLSSLVSDQHSRNEIYASDSSEQFQFAPRVLEQMDESSSTIQAGQFPEFLTSRNLDQDQFYNIFDD